MVITLENISHWKNLFICLDVIRYLLIYNFYYLKYVLKICYKSSWILKESRRIFVLRPGKKILKIFDPEINTEDGMHWNSLRWYLAIVLLVLYFMLARYERHTGGVRRGLLRWQTRDGRHTTNVLWNDRNGRHMLKNFREGRHTKHVLWNVWGWATHYIRTMKNV